MRHLTTIRAGHTYPIRCIADSTYNRPATLSKEGILVCDEERVGIWSRYLQQCNDRACTWGQASATAP
jgi:hypothetical protein